MNSQPREGWTQEESCDRRLTKPLGIPSGEMLLSHPRKQERLPGVGDVCYSKAKSEGFLFHSSSLSTVVAGGSVAMMKPQEAMGCAQVKVGLGKFFLLLQGAPEQATWDLAHVPQAHG